MAENSAEITAGACPKCGAVLEPKAIACAGCGEQVAKVKQKKIELTNGQKIAAIVLIINGLFLILELLLIRGTDSSVARSALVNIGIGAWMLSGSRAALTWAKIGTVIGAVAFPAIFYFVQHDIIMTVIQAVFSLSLIALLFGNAGKARVITALIFIVAYFGLEIAGFVFGGQDEQTPAVQEESVK